MVEFMSNMAVSPGDPPQMLVVLKGGYRFIVKFIGEFPMDIYLAIFKDMGNGNLENHYPGLVMPNSELAIVELIYMAASHIYEEVKFSDFEYIAKSPVVTKFMEDTEEYIESDAWEN